MELRSATALAKLFDVSPFTIRRLGYAGKLKEYRLGRSVRYDPSELTNLMKQGPREAKAQHAV